MAAGRSTGLHLSRLQGRVGYAGWGFADQAMSSLSNFGVGLVAVRSSSAEEYGAFSVAFATSVIGIGIARALISDVYSVRFAGGGPRPLSGAALDPSMGANADPEIEWIEAEEVLHEQGYGDDTPPDVSLASLNEPGDRYPHAAGAWGAALVLATIASLGCLAVGLIAGGVLRTSLLLLAVGMPFLVLQDVVRYVCIARRDAFGATLSDATWVLSFAAGIGVIVAATGEPPGANAALAAWLVGAGCGVIVGGIRMGVLPRIGEGIAFARLVWRQSIRYVIDWMALGASSQLGLYLLGATAGLAVLGETRTAFLLLGPINIVIMGATMVLVPELTRFRRRTGSRLFVHAAIISVLLELTAITWLGTIALLPEGLLTAVLGDGASEAQTYLAPLLVATSMVMISQGPVVCLRATGDIRRGTLASVPTAPFMLFGAALGAATIGGAQGAIVGTGLGFAVSGILSGYQLVRATRSAPIVFNHGGTSPGNH